METSHNVTPEKSAREDRRERVDWLRRELRNAYLEAGRAPWDQQKQTRVREVQAALLTAVGELDDDDLEVP